MKFVVKKKGKGLLFGHLDEQIVCETDSWGDAYKIVQRLNAESSNYYYWITYNED